MDDEYFEKFGYPLFYESIEEYVMTKPEVTNDLLYREIRELRVTLLGLEGTEDMGLYGEVRDMIKLQKQLNGTVRSDHAWVGALRWVMGFLFLLMAGTITATSIGLW